MFNSGMSIVLWAAILSLFDGWVGVCVCDFVSTKLMSLVFIRSLPSATNRQTHEQCIITVCSVSVADCVSDSWFFAVFVTLDNQKSFATFPCEWGPLGYHQKPPRARRPQQNVWCSAMHTFILCYFCYFSLSSAVAVSLAFDILSVCKQSRCRWIPYETYVCVLWFCVLWGWFAYFWMDDGLQPPVSTSHAHTCARATTTAYRDGNRHWKKNNEQNK